MTARLFDLKEPAAIVFLPRLFIDTIRIIIPWLFVDRSLSSPLESKRLVELGRELVVSALVFI
jgi:hypothetical protein